MNEITAITLCAFLLLQGGAFASEVEKRGSKQKEDAQMQKLHDMMPIYAIALAKMKGALEKEDPKAVAEEAGKILVTVADLKKGKPHKNLKQLKTFRSIAAGLESDLNEIVNLAKKEDFTKAKTVFKKADEKCTECHEKFRD